MSHHRHHHHYHQHDPDVINDYELQSDPVRDVVIAIAQEMAERDHNLVSPSELMDVLADYIPITNGVTLLTQLMQGILGQYVTHGELGPYVTSTGLASTLLDYIKNTDLGVILDDYPTETELAATLTDYVTNTDLISNLADFVTITSFNSTLLNYEIKVDHEQDIANVVALTAMNCI